MTFAALGFSKMAFSRTSLSGMGVAGAAIVAAGGVGMGCQEKDETATIRPAAAGPTAAPANDAGDGSSSAEAPARRPMPEKPATASGAGSSRVPDTEPLPSRDARRLRSEQKGFVVVTREDCLRGSDSYDLVVHFHGVSDAVERQWNTARLGGVLAVANAGTWGRDYKAVYERGGAYQRLLDRIDGQLAELCPERPSKVRRVALSGWSAGYAAIRAMLRDVGNEPVDAVLLSDGIHASLIGGAQGGRGVLPADVEPFVAFGELAIRGEKLLSITHSSIRTPDYASTTETTDYLLDRLGLERKRAGTSSGSAPPPQAPATGTDQRVELLTELEKQGFHLRGYSGESGPEHGWHLHALDDTLFADLRAWWSRPAP